MISKKQGGELAKRIDWDRESVGFGIQAEFDVALRRDEVETEKRLNIDIKPEWMECQLEVW